MPLIDNQHPPEDVYAALTSLPEDKLLLLKRTFMIVWLALMTTATTTSFPSHGVRELHQRRSPSFGQHCLLDQTPPLVKARLALGTTPQCPAHSPGSGAPDLDPDPPDPDPPDEAHTAFVATLPRVIVPDHMQTKVQAASAAFASSVSCNSPVKLLPFLILSINH